MVDHLKPVDRRLRRPAAVVVGFGALLLTVALTGAVALGNDKKHDASQKAIMLAIMTPITLMCWFVAVRLWSGKSSNGVTILPLWFIELFAIAMIVVVTIIYFVGPPEVESYCGPAGLGLFVSMLFIRRQLKTRTAAATEPLPTVDTPAS
jgi:uncharacterized membrane protein YhdT